MNDDVPGRGQAACWWHNESDGFRCRLCPRRCLLYSGQQALYFARAANEGGVVLATYGRSSIFVTDPVEKKPFNHFFPGTSVFSLGTAGCHPGCGYCRGWDITTVAEVDRLADFATSPELAQTAKGLGCASIAFSYNDPINVAEYMIESAGECRQLGLNAIVVTNGHISAEARSDFFAALDAVSIELKGFSAEFYCKFCDANIETVLETIEYVAKETACWLELTSRIIPGYNDEEAQIDALTSWVANTLGANTPIHFGPLYRNNKLLDAPPALLASLKRAREIGIRNGLRYVYSGDVTDWKGSNTWCPGCASLLIERRGYAISQYHLDAQGCCRGCATPIPGFFAARPGNWGNRFELGGVNR